MGNTQDKNLALHFPNLLSNPSNFLACPINCKNDDEYLYEGIKNHTIVVILSTSLPYSLNCAFTHATDQSNQR